MQPITLSPLALAVAGLSLAGPARSSAQLPDSIVVGVVYNMFHEEFESDDAFDAQVDRDITLMKASHITHVMLFPMGQWDPETRQLTWTRTDYIVHAIEREGMKFIPLLLKEEQDRHYFPIWQFANVPGLWDERNAPAAGGNTRDNIDFADPNIYPFVDAYFRQIAERYGKSPALSFYNIWNEPHYTSSAGHVVARFRNWLKQKYGGLPGIRRAWAEDYTSWDQVSPFLTENWASSMPEIDWQLFRNTLNGDLLGELTRTLRKYDTVHAVNANPVGTPWANFGPLGGYNIDNWPIADRDDIHGISYYPDGWERAHGLEPCPFWLHDLTFNTIRCVSGDKSYILTELYTNAQNGLALNGYLTRSSVTLLAWTALANDCKGMVYWKWRPFMRGRQSLGRGLCRVDGQLAPRGEAVKEFAAVVQRHGNLLFRAQLRKPRAAILLDMAGLLKTLGQSAEPLTRSFMYESNAGLFRALDENNISADVLRMDRPLTPETLDAYRILFLPFQIVMRRDVAAMLEGYVRRGGWVVADSRTATIDEQDFAYHSSPGAGLDTIFGAVRPDWTAGNRSFTVRTSGKLGLPRASFEGRYFRDSLQLIANVEVLGRFADTETPALILHRYGKGAAILSAVPLGASYYSRPEGRLRGLIAALAKAAGAPPDAFFSSDKPIPLSLKVHVAGNDMVIYAINAGGGSARGELSVPLGNIRPESVENILSDRRVAFRTRGDTLTVPLQIDASQAIVLHVCGKSGNR